MIEAEVVVEMLRTKDDGRLFRREGQELEFKEQFNFAGLSDYLRDFAGFANNRGGYLIFGVTDSPRVPEGLSDASHDQFEKIDPERISGFLLELFSPIIQWDQGIFEAHGRLFGVFRVYEATEKPVIAKKDQGDIRNGSAYYRYAGRTQVIQHAELENIINRRIEYHTAQWMDLMTKIASAGPQNAAVLDVERAVIEKNEAKIMVVDEDLAAKLKFIKEGQFEEKDGAPTLKLIGDVVPVEQVEVIKRVKENLIANYPLTALQLAEAVKKAVPAAKQHRVWEIIRENDIKNNRDYSAYVFSNKRQEDAYLESGELPAAVPSIYNQKASDFIARVIIQEIEDTKVEGA